MSCSLFGCARAPLRVTYRHFRIEAHPQRAVLARNRPVHQPDLGGAVFVHDRAAGAEKEDTGPPPGSSTTSCFSWGSRTRREQVVLHRPGPAGTKGLGSKYVEFCAPASPVKLSLLKRGALATTAGVPADAAGSHRLAMGCDAGTSTDPDGFAGKVAVSALSGRRTATAPTGAQSPWRSCTATGAAAPRPGPGPVSLTSTT
jgi:hypothetical protein